MTLIDLPVDGPTVDDTSRNHDSRNHDIRDHDIRDHDIRNHDGVTWTLIDVDEVPHDGPDGPGFEEPGDLCADEPLRSSYPRCSDGNGTLTHLFFSDDEFDIARAKSICGKCGLADACLSGALERSEPYGVWGGSLVIDGVIVEVKRGRGRPPKHPRPPLVVDEVPLPPHLVA